MKQKESGQKDASSSCKLNCQNSKSKSGWQHEKNQDKKKHHLLANHLCQNGKDESHPLANQIAKMANPNQVGNTKRIRTKRSIIFLRIIFAKTAKMNPS
jgi:hypothetical protein